MRCFIAAEISDNTRDIISKVMRHAEKDTLKVVDPALMHITLKFLGEINENELEECKRVVDECACVHIPVKFAGGGAFPNQYKARVVFVNVISSDLYTLAECIRKRTLQYGDNKPFVGHLTVARARSTPINAAKLIEKLNTIQIDDIISKVSIKKSTLTPTGPIYEDLYVKALK